MRRFLRLLVIALSAIVGLVIVTVVIIAAVNGRTVDPTDPVNYPQCATARHGEACQSP